MLMAFLASALEDTGAEAESTITHFSQAQQKIMLNHIQLISLASGFPLKWPDDIQVVRDLFYFPWVPRFQPCMFISLHSSRLITEIFLLVLPTRCLKA